MDINVPALIIALGALIYSACLHELAHAFVADRLGDPTPRSQGRLTFNPLPHIDPIMTLLIPALLFYMSKGAFYFAMAKPVMVSPTSFIDPKKNVSPIQGVMLSAAAGPVMNFLIAGLALGLIALLSATGQVHVLLSVEQAGITYIGFFLGYLLLANVFLGALNLIPLPGLDGSRILYYYLPPKGQRFMDHLSFFSIFVFIAFIVLGGMRILTPFFNVLADLLYRILGHDQANIFFRGLSQSPI